MAKNTYDLYRCKDTGLGYIGGFSGSIDARLAAERVAARDNQCVQIRRHGDTEVLDVVTPKAARKAIARRDQ